MKLLTAYVIIFYCLSSYAQETELPTSFYNKHDTSLGRDNLILTNGIFHQNDFRTINEKTRYLNNTFQLGDITYCNQIYFNLKLKYDMYKDQVILQPEGINGSFGIELLSKRIESFRISNRNFINIAFTDIHNKDDYHGFYEKIVLKNSAEIFIKLIAKPKKRTSRNLAYYEFTEKKSFYLMKDGILHPINTVKNIKKIFPEKNEYINDFFKTKKDLYRSDGVEFYKQFISTLNI